MPRNDSNPYEVLGLDRGATAAEVRAAYLRLAKKYHPDKNPCDKASEWIFRELQRAYETLRVANDVRSGEQERPSTAQENNVRRQAERARQQEQKAEEAERDKYEQWERQQAEDARRRWEWARAEHTARGADGTEPVCDDCESVARWWTKLPLIVQLSWAWTKWTAPVVFLGFMFSFMVMIALVLLWSGVWLMLVLASLLVGRPPPPPSVVEPRGDMVGVLAFALGYLLALRMAVKAEDKPKVCPSCGRVS